MMDILSGGVPPNIIQVRRCPKETRLAVDGLCYHKRILPAALRMNKARKAVVSWSEGQMIRKGARAAIRLKAITRKAEKEARRVAPPRRRRLTTGSSK